MSERSGPFWDAVEGRAPLSPSAAMLGVELIDADPEAGTVELAFAAREDFTGLTGNVLGAFLAAMLYDTLAPALLATIGPDQFESMIDMTIHFVRPVRPGRVMGRGRLIRRDREKAFLEASLFDQDEQLVANATATAMVIPRSQAAGAV